MRFATIILSTLLLVGCGGASNNTSTTNPPNPPVTTGSFSVINSMTVTRFEHSITKVDNENYLIAGGHQNSFEIYNTSTNTFNQAGTFPQAINESKSVTLLNGKILIISGDYAYIYNPADHTYIQRNTIVTCSNFTATLLGNGKVLVVGPTAQLFNPQINQFELCGVSNINHTYHTATLLQNGKVLIAGGYEATACEIYDPTTNTFSITGSMLVNNNRVRHSATLMQNGNVLITGGNLGSSIDVVMQAEIYNTSTGVFSSAGNTFYGRSLHCSTLLSNGDILISGGQNQGTVIEACEIYNATSNTFKSTANMKARYNHTSTLLDNGKVLITGGYDRYGPLSDCELYNP